MTEIVQWSKSESSDELDDRKARNRTYWTGIDNLVPHTPTQFDLHPNSNKQPNAFVFSIWILELRMDSSWNKETDHSFSWNSASKPLTLMILSRYSSIFSKVSFTRERRVSFYAQSSSPILTFFVKGHVFFGFRFSTFTHESYPITCPYGEIAGVCTGIIVIGSM